MSKIPTALIAFHSTMGEDLSKSFTRRGYSVTCVSTLENMLKSMSISEIDGKPSIVYELYIMDTNLGFSNEATCEPAARIYRLIEDDVKKGKVKFMSFTANAYAQRLAERAGIPVLDKLDFTGMLAFYESIPGTIK